MRQFILILILFSINTYGQNIIKGKITDGSSPVEFVTINLEGTKYFATTNEKGIYEIKNIPDGEYKLIISIIGYETVTKRVKLYNEENFSFDIKLIESSYTLGEMVVSGTMKPISKLQSPIPVEVYKLEHFQKNPTPSLFDAVQNINGIRPQLNCAICNTGDIHINGMEGPYTMVLIDGMPIVSGLSTVYGLSGIPNSMVERIEVVKGPASSLYGSEAVGGLINVITKSPENAALFDANVMTTSWLEHNIDIAGKYKLGKKVNSMIGVNYYNYLNPIDNNGDGFTDATLQHKISVFNKWSIKRNQNKAFNIAARYLYEDRWGGQMNWTPEYRGGDSIYGESIYTNRYEIFGNYQLPSKEKFMLSFSANSHEQNSYYGTTPYFALQQIAFGQLTWQKELGNHDLLTGISNRFTFYDDNTTATQINTAEGSINHPDAANLMGVFVQDEIDISEKLASLLGIRYDYHETHGNIFSPRISFKYSPNFKNTFRLSSGTGFRVVNIFTEDHAALTGARNVVIKEEIKPETSYNINLNYQKIIKIKSTMLTLDATAFYTYFTNKIIADYETNPNQIIYNNLNGYAVSNGFTLNSDFTFSKPFSINVGITLMDVYSVENNLKIQQHLTEHISGTWTISYEFTKIRLNVDYTGNYYGKMKLPLLSDLDPRAKYSMPFSIQNIKLSKTLRSKWEIYGGIKNFLNMVPPANSIANAHDPFDKNVQTDALGNVIASPKNPYALSFDPTYVYTSFQGIRGFAGIKFSFNR